MRSFNMINYNKIWYFIVKTRKSMLYLSEKNMPGFRAYLKKMLSMGLKNSNRNFENKKINKQNTPVHEFSQGPRVFLQFKSRIFSYMCMTSRYGLIQFFVFANYIVMGRWTLLWMCGTLSNRMLYFFMRKSLDCAGTNEQRSLSPGLHRGLHRTSRDFNLLSVELNNDTDGATDPRKFPESHQSRIVRICSL